MPIQTEKIKGKYQFKRRLTRLKELNTEIIASDKFPKDEVKDGFTHFITYKIN